MAGRDAESCQRKRFKSKFHSNCDVLLQLAGDATSAPANAPTNGVATARPAYPASVINEYLMLRLAARLGLDAPAVVRRYVPEPVYIIERFDRHVNDTGRTQRRHIIDACQLLNKPRGFKNRSANLQTLAECVDRCRDMASARLQLYRWLLFNVLVANDDNHLKNISFMVSAEGISLAPPDDMLSTSVYRAVAFADSFATWPAVEMMIPLPGATQFGQVTRDAMLHRHHRAQVAGAPPVNCYTGHLLLAFHCYL